VAIPGLLKTKLRRPGIPPQRVQRPQLVRRLNEGLESGRQITLVSAPAGFGKTICVCEWLDTLDDWPVAWLSLDPADDDPGRFFSYLIAALQTVDGSLGREIEGLLRAGQLPPLEILSTTLINDILDSSKRFLLVLDDFQVIQDAFILQVWEALVSNLPPQVHLVLLSREDPALPLSRLRANNQLSEIRVGDLRFSSRETERFLNQVMGLNLSDEQISLLEARTEGWIVGLQLAGLSMRGRVDAANFINELNGSHRYILSYLSEEVLSRQRAEIRLFLLQTSILGKLSGDLCDAVTGRSDSANVLERLLAANLFLIPLDDEQHWYRYHQLFGDLLRDLQSSLLADQTAELHRRASRWYARSGMVSEAIQHALDGGDYAMAVELFERHAMDMLVQWHVKTVNAWMRAIPENWVAQSLSANLTFAWMHLQRGDFDKAAPYLQCLQEMFATSQVGEDGQVSAPVPLSLQAKWLALQSMLLNAQGKAAESLELGHQALSITDQDDVSVLSMIYMGLAGAYQQLDDYAHALKAYQKIIQLGQRMENIVYEMLGVAGLVLMTIEHGQLHYGFEIASQGLERMRHSGSLPPVSTAVYGELGEVYYQWHQVEEANQNFLRSSQVSMLSGYSDAEIYHQVVRSRLAQMTGDLEAAVEEIEKAVDLMQIEAPSRVREEVIAQQVRVDLARNQLASAESALMRMGFSQQGKYAIPELEPGNKIDRPTGLLYSSALRILLYRAQTRGELQALAEKVDLADRMLDTILRRQHIQLALEMLLLRAQMHAALGNEQASRADLIHALELGEPEGFISVFLEEGPAVVEALEALLEEDRLGAIQAAHVRSILAHSSVFQPAKGMSVKQPVEAGIAMLVDPLTERELEVLGLIAEGLKYKEIGARLFISLNTVRSHVKAIYGKLGVDNRTKAIEAAHQLQIL
jgi:LuxR family transcriptional regulator, maltose regulon positive regulatory protein